MTTRFVSLSLLLMLVACEAPRPIELGREGEGEGEGEGEDEPATIADVVAAWDAVACGVFACVSHTRVTDEVCALAATAQGTPSGVIPFAAKTIAAVRGTFDVERGEACLALIATMAGFADGCFGADVDTFDDAFGEAFAASCGALVVGTVGKDGACVDDSECADGAECLADSNVFEGCERTCRSRLTVNESCVEHREDCDDGSVCDGTVCVSRNLKVTGSQCFDHGECVSQRCFNFACVDNSVRNGECVAEGDCIFGQYCRPLPPSTGLRGICEDHAAVGAACGFAVKCDGNQVCRGFAIRNNGGNIDGTCQAQPAHIGEACTPVADGYDSGDTGCFADLLCNETTSTCEVAPLLGAACTADGACGFSAWCNDGVCVAKKRRGETAPTPAACEDPTYYSEFDQVCVDADRNRCLAAF